MRSIESAPTRIRDALRCRHRQRGDALLEALVGVVIASVVGLGLSYTASRMMVSQSYATGQYAVLTQMTNSLTSQGVSTLCGGTAPTGISVPGQTASGTVTTNTITLSAPSCSSPLLTVSGPGNTPTATISAGNIYSTMTLSTPTQNTTAQTLIGGNGVMTISSQ